MENDLLTVQQVAEQFGITDQTVRRYIKNGILPVTTVGHRLLIRQGDLVKVPSKRRNVRTESVRMQREIDHLKRRVESLELAIHQLVKQSNMSLKQPRLTHSNIARWLEKHVRDDSTLTYNTIRKWHYALNRDAALRQAFDQRLGEWKRCDDPLDPECPCIDLLPSSSPPQKTAQL